MLIDKILFFIGIFIQNWIFILLNNYCILLEYFYWYKNVYMVGMSKKWHRVCQKMTYGIPNNDIGYVKKMT